MTSMLCHVIVFKSIKSVKDIGKNNVISILNRKSADIMRAEAVHIWMSQTVLHFRI